METWRLRYQRMSSWSWWCF